MEIPKTGRAIISEGFDQIQIIIPTKKNYWMIIMPFVAFGVFYWWMFPQFSKMFPQWNKGDDIFPIIWLVWAGFISLTGFRIAWWHLFGKEIVEAGQGILTIKRKGDWIMRTRSYDFAEARFFRADEPTNADLGSLSERGFLSTYSAPGTICFEYGAKTIRFGSALSDAEGNYILQKLRDKKILTDAHFVSMR